MSILRRAYVKVAPDTTDFQRELKERLQKIKADTEGDKLGKNFGTAFTKRFDAQLKSLHIPPIDLKANPRDALEAINKTQRELEGLRDHAGTVELRMRTEKALGDLTRFRKQLGDDFAKQGGEAAGGFAASFGEKVGPRLAIAAAPLGIALAPTILAAVAGAVVGAAGLGGVVGGLVLASKDTRVQAAAGALGETVMSDLDDRAARFVGPMLDGIAKVRAGFLALGPDLDRIFASSRFVDPLVTGAVAGAHKLVGGVADAVDKADPVIASLAVGFDQIGAAVGNAFSLLANDADEGASALNDLSLAVSNFITVTGGIIHATAAVKGFTDWIDIGIDKARIWIEDNGALSNSLSDVGISLDLTADGFKKGSAEADAYRRLVTGVGTAADVTTLRLAGMSDATLRRADASGKAVDAANQVTDASNRVGGAMQTEEDATKATALATQLLAAQQSQLKIVQDAVSASQLALQGSLDALGGKTNFAAQASTALKQAMDNQYGAAIRNTDANETYQASFDTLSETVKGNADQFKHNRDNLDLNTQAGRANRDALEGLLTSNGELYLSNIAAGVSEEDARKKHDNRTAAIKEEARHLGLNKTKTQELIDTYGNIPNKKITDLLLLGVQDVVRSLQQLYIYQRALATGKSVSSVEDTMRKGNDDGPSKAGGGFAAGGQIGGWSPNSTADNIPAWLTAEEWVHPVDAVRYYGPQIMGAIQKRQVPREVLAGFATGALGKLGDLPIFAKGGQVAPIDSSRRWPFPTDVSGTRIPSRAEVASKIPGGPGASFVRAQNGKPYVWAAAGPGGYDCSGIVSAVYNVLHGKNPYSHTFSTGSLPGHWFTKPGIGGPLTAAWSNPGQSPASSSTGHMMGMVGGLTFESSGSRGVHLGASTRRLTDFAHIAHYSQGGQALPFASYDSGGYLPPGLSLAHNGTGRPEPVGGGGVTNNVTVNVAGTNATPQQIATAVSRELGRRADLYARTV